MNIAPLVSNICPSIAFKFGNTYRNTENIYFRLMRRANIEITKIPFAKKKWNSYNYQELSDRSDYEVIEPTMGEDLLERDTRFFELLPLFEKYIDNAQDNFYDVYDKNNLKILIENCRGNPTPNQKSVLQRIAGCALWSSDWETRVDDLKMKIKE